MLFDIWIWRLSLVTDLFDLFDYIHATSSLITSELIHERSSDFIAKFDKDESYRIKNTHIMSKNTKLDALFEENLLQILSTLFIEKR